MVLLCGFPGLGVKNFALEILDRVKRKNKNFITMTLEQDRDKNNGEFRLQGSKGKSKNLADLIADSKSPSQALYVIENAHEMDKSTWDTVQNLALQGETFLLLCEENPTELEGSFLDIFRYDLRELPSWYFPVFLEEYTNQLLSQGFILAELSDSKLIHRITGGHLGLIESFFRKLSTGAQSCEDILQENSDLWNEANELVKTALNKLPPSALGLLQVLACFQTRVPLSALKSIHLESGSLRESLELLSKTNMIQRDSGSSYSVPDFIRNYFKRNPAKGSGQGHHDQCYQCLQDVTESHLRLEAFTHLNKVNSRDAIAFLENYFQETPFPEPLHRALECLDLALENDSNNQTFRFAKARVLHQMDRQQEALAELELVQPLKGSELTSLKGTILLHSDWALALPFLEDALKSIKPDEFRLRAEIIASIGGYYLNSGDHKRAKEKLQEGLELVREHHLDQALLARYLVSLNQLCLLLNAQQDADSYAQEILEIDARSLDLYTNALAGRQVEIEMERRSWDRTEDFLLQMRTRAASAGDGKVLGDYHFLYGIYSQLRGNGKDAIEHHRLSMALYRECGAKQRSIVAHSYLISAVLEEERLGDVDHLLKEFKDRAYGDYLPKANVRMLFYQTMLAALTDQPASMERSLEELSDQEEGHTLTRELLLFFSGYLFQKILNPWGATNFEYQPPKELVPLYSDLLKLHFEKIEKRFVCCTNRNGVWQALSRSSVETEMERLQQYDLFFDYTRDYYWEREQGEVPLEKSRVLQLIFLILCFVPGRRYSLEQIYEAVWQKKYNEELDEPTVRVAVNRLKKRIEINKDQYIGQGLLDGTFYLKSEVRFCLIIPEDEISHFRNVMEKLNVG